MYGGDASRFPDTNKLTPFNPVTSPSAISASTSSSVAIAGSQAAPIGVTLTVTGNTNKFSYGDQVLVEKDASNYMIGVVSCVNGTGIGMYNGLVSNASTCSADQIKVVVENKVGSGSSSTWSVYNYTQTGISFCNATPDSGSTTSQTSTAAPLMRAALGNFSLWSANERWQCHWRESLPSEATGSLGGTGTSGNRAALSGLWASSIGPNKTTTSSGRIANGVAGASSDFNVRVEACASETKLGNERCAKYGTTYKHIGLLQYYGESGQLMFGLMTGTYTKNQSGGVLRKNISNISDEINLADGTIKTAVPSTGSIIQSLNRMRIVDYQYSDGTYGGGCTFGQTSFTQGNCRSWGNPVSELYLESLRYLAGKSPTSAFTMSTSTDDGITGLRSVTWTDPLSSTNYCAPLNVLVFNSAVNSNEHDSQMGGASDIGTTGNTCDAATWTDKVGEEDGIKGQAWFVGNDGAGSLPADLCSTKTVNGFSATYGICPEGAGTEGSYLMSGLAYFARTKQIRAPGPLSVPNTDVRSLKVATFGIALATKIGRAHV
jgi:type IV pilus assembly protein PilY1